MKFFIDSKRPVDEATDIEREMPARIDVAKMISKRYRTDVYYFYADRVGMILIVDVDTTDQLSEIVLLLRRAGLAPEAYPLLPGASMSKVLLDVAAME